MGRSAEPCGSGPPTQDGQAEPLWGGNRQSGPGSLRERPLPRPLPRDSSGPGKPHCLWSGGNPGRSTPRAIDCLIGCCLIGCLSDLNGGDPGRLLERRRPFIASDPAPGASHRCLGCPGGRSGWLGWGPCLRQRSLVRVLGGRLGSRTARRQGDLGALGRAAQPLRTAIGSVDGISRREAAEAVLERNLGGVKVKRLQWGRLHRHDQGAGRNRGTRPADRLGLGAADRLEGLAVARQQKGRCPGTGERGGGWIEGPGGIERWWRRQRGCGAWCRPVGSSHEHQRRRLHPGPGPPVSGGEHLKRANRNPAQSAGCARIGWPAVAL